MVTVLAAAGIAAVATAMTLVAWIQVRDGRLMKQRAAGLVIGMLVAPVIGLLSWWWF